MPSIRSPRKTFSPRKASGTVGLMDRHLSELKQSPQKKTSETPTSVAASLKQQMVAQAKRVALSGSEHKPSSSSRSTQNNRFKTPKKQAAELPVLPPGVVQWEGTQTITLSTPPEEPLFLFPFDPTDNSAKLQWLGMDTTDDLMSIPSDELERMEMEAGTLFADFIDVSQCTDD